LLGEQTRGPGFRPSHGWRLFLQECEKLLIDDVGVGRSEAVGGAGNEFQVSVPDEFYAESAGIVDGHDLVGISLDDEGGDVDLFEVFSLIGFGEGLDAVVRTNNGNKHPLQPE
jgi:hypothetical protein